MEVTLYFRSIGLRIISSGSLLIPTSSPFPSPPPIAGLRLTTGRTFEKKVSPGQRKVRILYHHMECCDCSHDLGLSCFNGAFVRLRLARLRETNGTSLRMSSKTRGTKISFWRRERILLTCPSQICRLSSQFLIHQLTPDFSSPILTHQCLLPSVLGINSKTDKYVKIAKVRSHRDSNSGYRYLLSLKERSETDVITNYTMEPKTFLLYLFLNIFLLNKANKIEQKQQWTNI